MAFWHLLLPFHLLANIGLSRIYIAFDDQTSTFIVPSGAGFEIVLCPGGRSTNILGTAKQELIQLTQDRRQLNRDVLESIGGN